MNPTFKSNLSVLNKIFGSKDVDQISLIQQNIAFEDSGESGYPELIYLPSGLAISNISESSREAFEKSFKEPKRWQTPLFSFDSNPFQNSTQAFSDSIDSEDRSLLQYLMSKEMNGVCANAQPAKPTLVVFGFLNLVSLIDCFDDMPAISSIVVLEHSLERIACASCMFDFNLLLARIKELGCGFSVLFNKDSDSLVASFQSFILNTSPTSIYNLQLVLPNIPSPAFTRFLGWLESPQGAKIIVEMLFGNETDEINQIMNVSVNLNDTRNLSSLHITPETTPEDSEQFIVLTASGPSLDDDIPYLQSIAKTSTIVAAGSSIGTLLRNDIRPTALVILEMASLVYYDLLELIYEGYDFSGIELVASFSVDPRIRNLFGSFTAFSRPSMSTYSFVGDELNSSLLPQAGPQVANAALEVLLRLGYKNILLCGCDFSSPSNEQSRSKDAVGQSIRQLNLPVDSRQGGIVYSDPDLLATSQYFSNMLEAYNAKALAFGNGTILSNTRSITQDVCPSILSSEIFISHLKKNSILQPLHVFSESVQTILIDASNESQSILSEIKKFLSDASTFERTEQLFIDRYLTFTRPAEESQGRSLTLRLMRSLLLLIYRQMAVSATPAGFDSIKMVVYQQLEEFFNPTSQYFLALAKITKRSVPISLWDPSILARRLK